MDVIIHVRIRLRDDKYWSHAKRLQLILQLIMVNIASPELGMASKISLTCGSLIVGA